MVDFWVKNTAGSGNSRMGAMNWLAHLHLSQPDVEFRLGNVIADVIKGEARNSLAPGIQLGIACHHRIDNFTDAHDIFKHSRQCISISHRKFASILIDIFYDHFLSLHWLEYCATPLNDFIDEVYRSFDDYVPAHLPQAERFVRYMIDQDWLREYQTLDGIERTLTRVSHRLKRPGLLTPMVAELRDNYTDLDKDFCAFYPQLRAHATT